MNSRIQRVARALRLFTSISSRAQSPFLLFVRLYWGWQFMQTGWGKLHNLAQVTQFFTTLGIPYARQHGALCRLRGVIRRSAADCGACLAPHRD